MADTALHRCRLLLPVTGLLLFAAVACQVEAERAARRADAPAPTSRPPGEQKSSEVAAVAPSVERVTQAQPDEPGVFAANAFPPAIPDSAPHRNAWVEDCLRCHETGVAEAPRVVHRSVPAIAMTGKCRTCHVEIAGHRMPPRPVDPEALAYLPNAFPPMIPASDSHADAWEKDSCLLCHENGVSGAPAVKHEGMAPILLKAKCRTCHVQVRSVADLGR